MSNETRFLCDCSCPSLSVVSSVYPFLCDLTQSSRGVWGSTHRQTSLFLSPNNFLIVSSLPYGLLGRLEMGKALVSHSLCFTP